MGILFVKSGLSANTMILAVGRLEAFVNRHSNLLRKMPEHYKQFGWTEPDTLPYIWPTP